MSWSFGVFCVRDIPRPGETEKSQKFRQFFEVEIVKKSFEVRTSSLVALESCKKYHFAVLEQTVSGQFET